MTQSHTPGPWSFCEFELYPGADIRFNIFQAEGAPFTPHYSDVASTCAGEVAEIQKANARLIAAAPDLLQDLQAAAAQLRQYEALHRAKNTEDSLRKAEVNAELATRFERTIAKATE